MRGLVLVVLAFTTLEAQEPTLEELRAAVQEFELRVAGETAAVRAARTARAAASASSVALEESLAGEIVALELEYAGILERLRAQRTEVEAAEAAHARRVTASTRSMSRARILSERILLAAEEAAGDERLREPLVPPSDPSVLDLGFVELVLERADRIFEEASRVHVQRVTMRTASGRSETVDLLTAGHVSAAYRSSGDRFGLRLESPVDARGYRWTEDVSEELRTSLLAAFVAAETASSDRVSLATDVTRTLRADDANGPLTLIDRLRSGGPVMIPIGLLALLALALTLERTVALLAAHWGSQRSAAQVYAACVARDRAQAQQAARGRNTVARTLAAVLARGSRSREELEDAANAQLLVEAPRVERFLSTLGIVAAVAPLLGLLGTVTGIIQTFDVLQGSTSPQPGLLAGGISEALVTTAFGLAVAIPVLLVHGLLRAGAERVLGDAEREVTTLVNALTRNEAT